MGVPGVPATGRFLPGNSGNGGRPKGSKAKYAEAFWADLCEVWEAKGKQALEDAVTADPVRFVAVAAQVLPKDVNVKNEATDSFGSSFPTARRREEGSQHEAET